MGFFSFCKWKGSVGNREFLDFCMLKKSTVLYLCKETVSLYLGLILTNKFVWLWVVGI